MEWLHVTKVPGVVKVHGVRHKAKALLKLQDVWCPGINIKYIISEIIVD